MKKKTAGMLLIGLFLVIAATAAFGMVAPHPSSPVIQPTNAVQQQRATSFTYDGEEGKDALTLLQEKTPVEQDDSGLVTTITGRKADVKKKEFWAFYVNGKMAQIGPKEYVTKNGDKIEWKIETY